MKFSWKSEKPDTALSAENRAERVQFTCLLAVVLMELAFSNGTVIATAIHGFGLSGTKNDAASDVVWKVSRDNGKSWSSEFVMNKDLYDGYRGNISPGNICVGKEGHLKGKALVGLRTSTSPNNGYSVSETKNRVYCMTYDPDKNAWTNVKVGDGDSLFHEEVHQRGFPDVGISDDVDKTGFVLLICHVVWW